MLKVTARQLPNGNYTMYYNIDAGEARFAAGVDGIQYDFNLGGRVQVPSNEYKVQFIDLDLNEEIPFRETVVHKVLYDEKMCNTNIIYHKHIGIRVSKNGQEIWRHDFNAKGKNVHIEMLHTRTIGDNICFMPAVEEFRRQHGCEVYVTIHKMYAEIFAPSFKEIHFIPSDYFVDETEFNTNIWEQLPKDIYATYYLEVGYPAVPSAQKIDLRLSGMVQNCANILGVDYQNEFWPRLLPSEHSAEKNIIKEPYVCIGMKGSKQCKDWNNPKGWGDVVRFLKAKGFRVLCIDGEDITKDMHYQDIIEAGCEEFTGMLPLQERIDLLHNAKFFMGVGSGLSWLAWAAGIPVVMISGFSLPHSEFYTPYRVINTEVCHGCWSEMRYKYQPCQYTPCPVHAGTSRQWECTTSITSEMVLEKVKRLLKDYNLDNL